MSTLHVKYLLVGGGVAASAAAKAIRDRDREGAAMLIGQEIHRPYIRPLLSKSYIRRESSRTQLFVDPMGWYSEHQVALRTGRRVAMIDTNRRCATLDSGEDISFDSLLLAVGSTPRLLKIPGSDLPNLFYLRTIEDADRLHHAIDKARLEGRRHERGRGRVAVIGASLLGVELAASFTQVGLKVELIAGHSHLWYKYAGDTTAKVMARYLEERDITVHVADRPQRLEGDGRVQRVVLASGQTVECDFVVTAVGTTFNRDILRGTPIAAEKAILVDDTLRTNVPGIFAAGDCAAVFDPRFGKHRIVPHWEHARLTGSLAGANMAGEERHCDAVNAFFSDVFDVHLQAWGDARFVHHRLIRSRLNGCQSALRQPGVTPELVEIGVAADGRVAQVLAIGHAEEHGLLHRLVETRFDVSGKEEQLKDPASDLRALLGEVSG